mmetsp:Transcript_84714/g.244875  ORF Transcript_84714/g.244875 Transcript_84714/m.244875 type:complete len:649 (-) Transcript_84714:88-2034(-)
MARWQQRSRGAGRCCAQCGAGQTPLVPDKASGYQYCDGCWTEWTASARPDEVDRPPNPRGGAERRLDGRGEPPDKLRMPQRELDEEGLWPPCAPSSSSSAAPVAVAATAPAGGDLSAPLAADDRGAVDAVMRFAAEVAELRRQFLGSEQQEVAQKSQEEQRSEVESLTAIYGDALQVLSADGELPLAFRLELSADIEGEGTAEIIVTTPDGEAPAGLVEELPPLVLYCALPLGYPLDVAARPRFVVDAEHLSASAIEELEAALRALSDQHAGEPLLFEWSSALQERFVQPRRVVLPDSADSMGVALRLLAHSRAERDRRRCRELQTCPMCLDEVLGSRGVFLDCGHFGCRDCLEQMALLHASESDVAALRCPAVDCRRPIDAEVLRDLLSSDPVALKKWEDESLRRCLEHMQDVVFCPRCDADGDGERVPVIEDSDHMARCEVCFYVFCGRCKGVYHPDTPCSSTEDRLDALEAKAAGVGPEAKAARAELMTLRHLAKTTKSCPQCSMAIEKTDGCSKVLCGNCKVHFCWRCNKVIDGYDHFATSDCRLFDDDEIRRWNQQVKTVDKAQVRAHEARFLAQFIDPAKLWEQFRPCPRCRNAVLRDGKNNHLRCFACSTHFCARCREILPGSRPGDHFQKRKTCPQHSDD